ncbi:hypothetical protein QJU39_10085 [Pasteurella atlantica]|nr:hypothetical protein [Pasteurella atlantica]
MYSLHILILQLNKLKNVVKSICYNLSSAVSTVTELDKDGDGIADTTTEVITKGDCITTTKVYTDSNDDGTQDSFVEITNRLSGYVTTETGTITHNTDGTQIIKYEVDKYSNNGQVSGRIDTLDAEGNVIKSEYDLNNDGRIDKTETKTYNDDNTVKVAVDTYNDGKVDSVTIETYDSNGNIIKNEYDRDNDGVFEASDTRIYDDKNHLIVINHDTNNDGTTDSIDSREYDKVCNLSKQVLDRNADGQDDYIILREFDEKGWTTKTSYDTNGDGTIEKSMTYERMPLKGHSLKQFVDKGDDGSIDQINTFEYDDFGQVIKREYDYTNDGVVDATFWDTYNENQYISTLQDKNQVKRLFFYSNAELSSDEKLLNLEGIYIQRDNISITISDDVLDKIASDENSHKVVVNSTKTGDMLNLDGNFTKTTETESHSGQDCVKYTDEVGNALIVDPDITVNII